jgi:hypothetical protein
VSAAEVKARQALVAKGRKAGAEAALKHRRENVAHRRASSSYAIMLLDHWKDPTLLSMVGRFDYKGRYIDAIYLPAQNPTSLGWAQAVRTLQRDRQMGLSKAVSDRVLRITGNGTERVMRPQTRASTAPAMSAWKPLPPAALHTMETAFRKRLLPRLQSAPVRDAGNHQTVRLIRWPR